MRVPGLMMYKDAALTCFSRGRTMGLVVDIGEEFTRCCGVFDGFVDPQYVSLQKLAGKRLGECYTKQFLNDRTIVPRGVVLIELLLFKHRMLFLSQVNDISIQVSVKK